MIDATNIMFREWFPRLVRGRLATREQWHAAREADYVSAMRSHEAAMLCAYSENYAQCIRGIPQPVQLIKRQEATPAGLFIEAQAARRERVTRMLAEAKMLAARVSPDPLRCPVREAIRLRDVKRVADLRAMARPLPIQAPTTPTPGEQHGIDANQNRHRHGGNAVDAIA